MGRIYRLIYKDIVADVGIDAAYLLAELIARQGLAVKNGTVSPDGWFVFTQKEIEDATGIERTKQFRLLKKLTAAGYIKQENINGIGRRFLILSEQPQKEPDTRANMNGLPAQICTGSVAKMRGFSCKNARVPNNNKIINVNSYLNSLLSSSEQQQFFDLIVVYFRDQIGDPVKAENEAAEFYKYNRETFGADHLTIKNYKRHAAAWIKAGKHPPKKTGASKRGTKTAAEVAESQGVTVAELMNLEPLPITVKADDIAGVADIFGDIFGGEQ